MNNIDFKILDKKYLGLVRAAGYESFDDISDINFSMFKNKEFVTGKHPEVYTKYFQVGGEDCYQCLKLINFYLLAKKMTQMLIEVDTSQDYYILNLMRARMGFLHAQLMAIPTEVLRVDIMDNYEAIFKKYDANNNLIDQ